MNETPAYTSLSDVLQSQTSCTQAPNAVAVPIEGTGMHRYMQSTFMASFLDKTQLWPIEDIKPSKKTLRKHPASQVQAMAASLERFGCPLPLLVRPDGTLIDGHLVLAGLMAAGATHVVVTIVDYLSDTEIRALTIALNKIGEQTEWVEDQLIIELNEILNAGIDLEIVGSDTIELDGLNQKQRQQASDPADNPIELPAGYIPTCKLGDVWVLGEHRLICGDAAKPETYQTLLGNERVQMVFTDPPYNVRINGHVKR